MAPELLDKESAMYYDHKVDSWSLGIVLHELLTFRPPFYSDSKKSIEKQILKSEVDYDKLQGPGFNLSPEACSLLRKLLNKDPKRRISAEDALLHKWFSNEHFEE